MITSELRLLQHAIQHAVLDRGLWEVMTHRFQFQALRSFKTWVHDIGWCILYISCMCVHNHVEVFTTSLVVRTHGHLSISKWWLSIFCHIYHRKCDRLIDSMYLQHPTISYSTLKCVENHGNIMLGKSKKTRNNRNCLRHKGWWKYDHTRI